jgi:hypothetical protein
MKDEDIKVVKTLKKKLTSMKYDGMVKNVADGD